MSTLRGMIPVLPTPFEDGRISSWSLQRHIDELCDAGASALTVLGSTSEGPSLSESERTEVIELTLAHVAGRVPVIVGVSAVATATAAAWARQAATLGADALMLTPPLYWRPRVPETIAHYWHVADVTDLPIIVYNNPWATGVDLEPQTLAELAAHPNIACVKESSGVAGRVAAIVELAGKSIDVFCGTDNLVLEALHSGAVGWISGAVNLFPRQAARLVASASEEGDWTQAEALYRRLAPTLILLETSGQYVQLVKAGLAVAGKMDASLRLPLLPADGSALRDLFAALGRAEDAATELYQAD
jgi:4-hydroxy-tetrahydrodipicolinate synthase